MSAQIPETMLLSDLLKATGYDCPVDLQGRTFAEATAGGDVQTNKAATIDVSAYTEPIVIKPDTDYESMKKNTITLSNIPVVPTLEDNKAVTIDVSTYTEPVEITPSEGKDGMEKVTVTLENIPTPGYTKLYHWENSTLVKGVYTTTDTPTTSDTAFDIQSATYARKAITSATTTKLVIGGYDYSRHSAGDIDLTV